MRETHAARRSRTLAARVLSAILLPAMAGLGVLLPGGSAEAQAAPSVVSIVFITSPALDDTYRRGEAIRVRVEFDRDVRTIGSAALPLTIGTQTRSAWNDAELERFIAFSYTVREDDLDTDGISIAADALTAAAGIIKDAAGTVDAILTHAVVHDDPNHKVDGKASPYGVGVSPQRVTVAEGGASAYELVLTARPSRQVTITVSRAAGGDPDLTATPARLTFSSSDWDAPQTVTVSAAEDDDTTEGTATFTHTVSSSDANYDGIDVAPVTATEGDDDFAHDLHFFPLDTSTKWEGFARIINYSGEAGEVRIEGADDAGSRFGPITLSLDAFQTRHFNSGDLADGNPSKGLPDGLNGGAVGNWRLRLITELDIEPLAYIRTEDGFVTTMHEVAHSSRGEEAVEYYVPIFNPGGNRRQVSRLRLVNPGEDAVDVTITGTDDDGMAPPGGEVSLTLPAGEVRTISAQQLEAGGGELSGSFGDGSGKWRLLVTAGGPVEVMSLLESPTGHLANLSVPGVRGPAGAVSEYRLPLFMAASNQTQQGFARIINHSDESGTVTIHGIDDAGTTHGPVGLSLGPNETRHFNSMDLEGGNAPKGLSGRLGDGDGDWHLSMTTALDIEPLAYIRTADGFVTTMHERARRTARGYHVPIFNPGSNRGQRSRLRLINPTAASVSVTITGLDDAGNPPPGGEVRVTLPARSARTITARQLESGGGDFSGRFGDGVGKWQLFVDADARIEVLSLLESPTGHLANLSATPGAGNPIAGPLAIVEIAGKATASAGTPVVLSARTQAVASGVTIDRFDWTFSDGQAASGIEVSVTFPDAGVYTATVEAVSGTEAIADTTATISVFDLAGGANPGFEALPDKFGDVGQDDRLGLDDLLLAAQGAAGLTQGAAALYERGAGGYEAADMDLSGTVDEKDVGLIARALLSGRELPSEILADFVYPGGVATMVSPALLDPDADIAISVEGVQVPDPVRAVLGYATFVIPNDADARDAEVDVVVEADGVAADRMRVLLKRMPEKPPGSAKDDVMAFFDQLAQWTASYEADTASFIEQNGVLSTAETDIALAGARIVTLDLEAAIEELEVLLNSPGGEELAEFMQDALYANGLAEFRENYGTSFGAAANRGGGIGPKNALISPSAVCDFYVPLVCDLKLAAEVISGAASLMTATCAAISVAAIVSGVGAAAGLTAFLSTCLPLAAKMTLANWLGEVFSVIDMDMRLTASTTNLSSNEMAIITAEVTFLKLGNLCTKLLPTKLANLVLEKILGKKLMGVLLRNSATKKILGDLWIEIGETAYVKLLELIQKELPRVLPSQVIGATENLMKNVCGFINLNSAYEGGVTADAGDFNLRATNGGVLRLLSDGTASLACPVRRPGFPGFVEVMGTKLICADVRTDEVRVNCEGRQVTITMGDNGLANDDIFEVSIGGRTVLTSSSPVRSISVTLELPVGRTTVVMSGRAAPDGIGTYYINFSGATVISGQTSGDDLVPGVRKTIVIEVQ